MEWRWQARDEGWEGGGDLVPRLFEFRTIVSEFLGNPLVFLVHVRRKCRLDTQQWNMILGITNQSVSACVVVGEMIAGAGRAYAAEAL